MPITRHREMHTKSGASRMYPVAPVRVVHSQSKPAGWLDCSVAEFMQLLARHEAGEIDLLAMPELTGDEIDDDDEVTTTTGNGGHTIGDSNTDRVRRCLTGRQLTVTQIADATGLSRKQVRNALTSNPMFARSKGEGKQLKLWRLK